jgi:hypothetical protein
MRYWFAKASVVSVVNAWTVAATVGAAVCSDGAKAAATSGDGTVKRSVTAAAAADRASIAAAGRASIATVSRAAAITAIPPQRRARSQPKS